MVLTTDNQKHQADAPDLELPITGLVVCAGHLVRLSDKGAVLARIPLDQIRAIEVRRRTVWGMLGVGMALLGVGVLGKCLIPSARWAWTVAVHATLIGLLFIAGARDVLLRLKVDDQTVELDIHDSFRVAVAFVTSLQITIDESNRN